MAWHKFIQKAHEGAILVPSVVLTECFTGEPRDAYLYRFLNAINGGATPRAFALSVDFEGAVRAGALRTRAMKNRDGSEPISAADAQLVALAEANSFSAAVTILPGDPTDIQALVDCTGRPNIAVDIV